MLTFLNIAVFLFKMAVVDDKLNKQSILELEDITPSVLPESGQPFLFTSSDGSFVMSWMEPGETSRHALRYSVYDSKAWSAPKTIASGDDFFVNWADVPSVAKLSDGRLAAHWLKKSGPSTYAYDVMMSQTNDNGKSWSVPQSPHSDGTQTEHGFVSFFELPNRELGLIWLDGREMAGSTSEHDGHGGKGSMTLRFAGVDGNGTLAREEVIDHRVCECCPTSATRTRDGIVIAYRDRSDTEVRNIAVATYKNGKWSKPKPVHDDNWMIPGCPVNGPSLSSADNFVSISWFTAPAGKPKVLVSFSEDGGTTFSAPIRIDGGKPLGRVASVLLPDRSALVGWLEHTDQAAEFRVRIARPDGTLGPSFTVAQVSSDRRSGNPRIARSGNTLLFAWTDVRESKGIRVAKSSLKSLLP